MILHLGVVDIPYANGAETTGDVAERLEDYYGVMGGYVELHLPEIAQGIEDALAGSLESLMMGAPVTSTPFASGVAKIEQGFRRYLDEEEITKLGRRGVPTKAAMQGISHRFKNPRLSAKNKRKGLKRNPPRPSFIDTGLYQTSFKAWVE